MNNQYKIGVIILIWTISLSASAQHLEWKAEMVSFFDNTEFHGSPYTTDQTMGGVHFAPQIGAKWQKNHSIYGGVNIFKEYGSREIVDRVTMIAYYQYKSRKTLFRVGAFTKNEALAEYSPLLISDSIALYRPAMNGLYLRQGDKNRYFKLWLDWLVAQDQTRREQFAIGTVAHVRFLRHFYFAFQGYLMHLANTRPMQARFPVSENLQSTIAIGTKFYDRMRKHRFNISVGTMVGFERNRSRANEQKSPIGTVVNIDYHFKNFGIDNWFYYGDKRYNYPTVSSAGFYWLAPFLKGRHYILSDIHWNAIDNRKVKAKLSVRMHHSEQNLYFEQMLTVGVRLNGKTQKERKKGCFCGSF